MFFHYVPHRTIPPTSYQFVRQPACVYHKQWHLERFAATIKPAVIYVHPQQTWLKLRLGSVLRHRSRQLTGLEKDLAKLLRLAQDLKPCQRP